MPSHASAAAPSPRAHTHTHTQAQQPPLPFAWRSAPPGAPAAAGALVYSGSIYSAPRRSTSEILESQLANATTGPGPGLVGISGSPVPPVGAPTRGPDPAMALVPGPDPAMDLARGPAMAVVHRWAANRPKNQPLWEPGADRYEADPGGGDGAGDEEDAGDGDGEDAGDGNGAGGGADAGTPAYFDPTWARWVISATRPSMRQATPSWRRSSRLRGKACAAVPTASRRRCARFVLAVAGASGRCPDGRG